MRSCAQGCWSWRAQAWSQVGWLAAPWQVAMLESPPHALSGAAVFSIGNITQTVT